MGDMSDETKGRRGTLLPLGKDEDGDGVGLYMDERGASMIGFRGTEPGEGDGSAMMEVRRREDSPLWDTRVVRGDPHGGPCRCNSKAYRDGWDRIWGPKEPAEA